MGCEKSARNDAASIYGASVALLGASVRNNPSLSRRRRGRGREGKGEKKKSPSFRNVAKAFEVAWHNAVTL